MENLYTTIPILFDDFFKKKGDNIQCGICLHVCDIGLNQKGSCGVYKNEEYKIYALEKLPVSVKEINTAKNLNLHFLEPNHKVWVLGFWGCNFRCKHCINFKKSYIEIYEM